MHRRKGGKSTGPLSPTPDLSLATKMDWDFADEIPFTPENMCASLESLTATPDSETEVDPTAFPPVSPPVLIPISIPAAPFRVRPGQSFTWVSGLSYARAPDGRRLACLMATATLDGQVVHSSMTPLVFPEDRIPNHPRSESPDSQKTPAAPNSLGPELHNA